MGVDINSQEVNRNPEFVSYTILNLLTIAGKCDVRKLDNRRQHERVFEA